MWVKHPNIQKSPTKQCWGSNSSQNLGWSWTLEKGIIKWDGNEMAKLPQGNIVDKPMLEKHTNHSGTNHSATGRNVTNKDHWCGLLWNQNGGACWHFGPLERKAKTKLLATLDRFSTFFGGASGLLKIQAIQIELKNGAIEYHANHLVTWMQAKNQAPSPP